jgi:hypothetical protein
MSGRGDLVAQLPADGHHESPRCLDLGDRLGQGGQGRMWQVTAAERSRIIGLVR